MYHHKKLWSKFVTFQKNEEKKSLSTLDPAPPVKSLPVKSSEDQDVKTRRITAEAAKENAKTLGEKLIKEMEVKGQELDLQEKRMILDAIQGGVDSVLKFGFLKKKGGK